ncbi:serine O-acetyltransferase [Alcaligenaceae bacterium LF4-65]|jgi:serine O-acetyltransferase|uniref:Serine acetyltransferase n=1 Tax=Zwartia hollandica TaxID=324606 RepID=A0A953NCQ9_9BURK|nr:serine O-acetyltransferase [Zwartia hollandica]MBZ1351254.1 serine O-acetyltransferase [Zwartia hollandica]
MFNSLRENIACILERDPAARSKLEILTCYPGLHAIMAHKLAHRLWQAKFYWLGRMVSHLSRMLTGIEIHPGATIGRRVFIDHGFGVVIGETSEIGDDCTIYQGVTLGGTRLYKGAKRHPTLGKGVVVGAGAQVLGGFTVGDGARIGSNAVVVKPVPAGATAVGNPARIIEVDAAPSTTDSSSAATPATTTSTKISPCDSDWDAAPIQAMLDKGPAKTAPIEGAAFTAYAVDPAAADPLVKALHELITHVSKQDARIAHLCQTIESMGSKVEGQAAKLDAQRLNKLVDE